MFRVSVTTIESYRRYINEVSPVDTEVRLVEKLEGKFTGNDKTRIGSAFHSIIEDPDAVISPIINPGGKEELYFIGPDQIKMNFIQVDLALRYRRAHPQMIHEVPIYKIYQVPRCGEVMVTGKVDGIEGRQLRDLKTKFSGVNYEEYLDSAQWKFYLDILGLDVFFYDFIEIKGFDEHTPTDVTKCQFIPQPVLKCDRYINLSKDVENLVVDFFEYIHDREFYNLLKQAHNYEKDPLF
jgi:hypothetical protein